MAPQCPPRSVRLVGRFGRAVVASGRLPPPPRRHVSVAAAPLSAAGIISYDHPPVRLNSDGSSAASPGAPSPGASPAGFAPAAAPPRRRTDITEDAWADGTRLVTVYVDWPGAEALPADACAATLAPGGLAVELALEPPDTAVRHVLKLAPLAKEVEGATLVRRGDQLVLKLRKKVTETWYELKKGAGFGADPDDDDVESFVGPAAVAAAADAGDD